MKWNYLQVKEKFTYFYYLQAPSVANLIISDGLLQP